jgi:hypothetical protein
LFARKKLEGWTSWGNQAETYEEERPVIRGYNGHALNGSGHGGKALAEPDRSRARRKKTKPDNGPGLF